MTKEQLDAIRARVEAARAQRPFQHSWNDIRFGLHALEDSEALLAEVERLTAERDAAFKRGVAAMREAAAGHAYFFAHPSALCGPTARAIADEIRALPDPEDTE